MSKSFNWTPLRRKFVEFYAGKGREAAIKAGYSESSAGSYAVNLLKQPEIQEAIRAREGKRITNEIATREQRQKFWTEVMNDPSQKQADRLRASELLGKSEGDFLDRVEHNVPGMIIRMPEKKPDGAPVTYQERAEA